jgi:HPt (histidine-containing phosphotransfer) domain-containing protein
MAVELLRMDGYLAQSLNGSALTDGAATEAIDPGVFASLDEAWEEGEPDLIVELIDIYLSDAPQWVEAMRTAVAGRDATLLRRAAHTLKGSSGSMGIRKVAEACAMLEQLDVTDSAEVEERLQLLDREFVTARAALAAERMRRVA